MTRSFRKIIFELRSGQGKRCKNRIAGSRQTFGVFAAGLSEERLTAASAFDFLGGFTYYLAGVIAFLDNVVRECYGKQGFAFITGQYVRYSLTSQ